MRPLKVQFFLSYAIIGSLAPLLPLFLKDFKALDDQEVGLAMSMISGSTLFSPTLMTLLADTHLQTRHILALAYACTAVALLLLLLPGGMSLTLFLMALYGLSVVAMFPLQDGLYFSAAQEKQAAGEAVAAYPRIRVWGTLGFIVPSVALWWIVHATGDPRGAVLCAVICCVASLFNSLFGLPHVSPAPREPGSRLFPTAEAFRILWHPRTRFLCLALIIAAGTSVTYHYFFPIYLKEHIGLAPEWIPLVITLGVIFEVFYTLALPFFQRTLGVKGILLAGLGLMGLRLLLLGTYPTLGMALLVQLGHGMEIMAMFILPPILLDQLAGNEFRNSMQGAFTMMMGASRFIGSLFAGVAVKHDMLGAFRGASLMALVALAVVAFLFRVPTKEQEILPTAIA